MFRAPWDLIRGEGVERMDRADVLSGDRRRRVRPWHGFAIAVVLGVLLGAALAAALPVEDDPLVQAPGPRRPKLDALRHQPEAGPMGRTGNLPVPESLLHLADPLLQRRYLALSEGDEILLYFEAACRLSSVEGTEVQREEGRCCPCIVSP